ncbi:MFS transporter [Rhodopseudomonas sp. BR0M22]|uniref:MFS transporter n=1 Tax=Rhodopseudomonas sp. BR0M22 TaxID=2269369 RepID=UPI0019688C72|nr:MFS transporter [Rhodopseudomonas sp. BR0M22]
MSSAVETLETGFAAPRRYFAAAAILIGVLMAAIDSSIVNIALPSIAQALEVDSASVIWVANGYQVASASTMLIFASLGARLGERRFYAIGMVLFTLSSLGCAVSTTFAMLVFMRVAQGISYAIMISVGLGLYRAIFPPSALGMIFGLNALAFAIGTAVGPALGGLIISYLSWPWLFYINIPLGLVAIYFSISFLGLDSASETGFDFAGAFTSAGAFGLLVVAVDEIGRWSDLTVGLLLATSAILLAIFLFIQTKAKSPLLPLDIFTQRRYSFAVLSSVTMFVSQGMALVALPFVLQHTYSYSVLTSSLIFTAWPLAVAICAPLSGSLSAKFNATHISTAGVALFCIGFASLAVLPRDATIVDLVWRIAICGVGYGFFLPPNNKEMFSNVEKRRAVTASGVLSTARTAGQSIGAALVAMIIVLSNGLAGSAGGSFIASVFGVACAICSLSALFSMLRIHR